MRTHEEFYLERYGVLEGATILKATVDLEGDQEGHSYRDFTPMLVIRLGDNKLTKELRQVGKVIDVYVSQDPEGNGPGYLEGLPFPAKGPVSA